MDFLPGNNADEWAVPGEFHEYSSVSTSDSESTYEVVNIFSWMLCWILQ